MTVFEQEWTRYKEREGEIEREREWDRKGKSVRETQREREREGKREREREKLNIYVKLLFWIFQRIKNIENNFCIRMNYVL